MQPASPKAKYAAHDRKGPRAVGHICFVLSGAKPSNVTSAPPVCQQRGHTSNVALATPTTTFAIGFNYQVSMSFSFYVDGMRDN